MSQPETTPAADGASALLAAADRTAEGPRRKRFVPKGTAATAAKGAPKGDSGAQEPAGGTEPPPASEETGDAPSATQAPPERPRADAPRDAPPEDRAVPAPPADDTASAAGAADPADRAPSGGTTSTTDVAFPATPLRFESVFSRPKYDMDPELMKMYRLREEKILKSLANIVTMFLDKKDEFEAFVRGAVAAGFPKDELIKLAIQYDCGPFVEAALGEQLPTP